MVSTKCVCAGVFSCGLILEQSEGSRFDFPGHLSQASLLVDSNLYIKRRGTLAGGTVQRKDCGHPRLCAGARGKEIEREKMG